MKCIIIVCCLLVSVYGVSQDVLSKLMEPKISSEIVENCTPEVGATEADIAELLEKKLPTRKEGKCLLACIENKIGVMKDGKFDTEAVMSVLEPLKANDPDMYKKITQAVTICREEVDKTAGPDECERAVIGLACSQRVSKELGIDNVLP